MQTLKCYALQFPRYLWQPKLRSFNFVLSVNSILNDITGVLEFSSSTTELKAFPSLGLFRPSIEPF